MKIAKHISIKKQIGTAFVAILFILVCLIMALFHQIYVLALRQAEEGYEESSLQLFNSITYQMEQVEYAAENILYSKIIDSYIGAERPLKVMEQTQYARDYLYNLSSQNTAINDIFLYIVGGHTVNGISYVSDNIAYQIRTDYDLQHTYLQEQTYSKIYYNQWDSKYFAYLRNVPRVEPDKKTNMAVICNVDSIQRLVDDYGEGKVDAVIKVTDQVGQVVAVKGSNEDKAQDYDRAYTKRYRFDKMGWHLDVYIPLSISIGGMNPVLLKIMLYFTLSIIVILVIFTRLTLNIMHPINRLYSDVNKHFKQDDNPETIRGNEINYIRKYINSLLLYRERTTDQLLEAKDKVHELELSEKQAQIALLQSQINPHFLYNNLECIRSIALVYDCEPIQQLAIAMAKLYRYSIKGDEITTLSQEKDYANYYVQIMNIRYNNQFTLDFEVEEDILDCPIPKMVFQPIIENAILHGLMGIKTRPCKLHVRMYRQENYTIIDIEDNGAGMSREALRDLRKSLDNQVHVSSKKIGLSNIHHRLRYYFGEKSGITIHSVEGEYTLIKLHIVDTK